MLLTIISMQTTRTNC